MAAPGHAVVAVGGFLNFLLLLLLRETWPARAPEASRPVVLTKQSVCVPKITGTDPVRVRAHRQGLQSTGAVPLAIPGAWGTRAWGLLSAQTPAADGATCHQPLTAHLVWPCTKKCCLERSESTSDLCGETPRSPTVLQVEPSSYLGRLWRSEAAGGCSLLSCWWLVAMATAAAATASAARGAEPSPPPGFIRALGNRSATFLHRAPRHKLAPKARARGRLA